MPSIVVAMAARASIGLCPIRRRDVGKADRAALRAEGGTVSRGRVERLMRRHGLRGVAARRFRSATTDSRHGLPVAPDLLEQDFHTPRPNQIWLSDIT